uniref:Uncharacterized protein n=1 Tax=Hemiselmis andersenii TaxID=464988 RepID=A0A7S1DXI3_HEMAN
MAAALPWSNPLTNPRAKPCLSSPPRPQDVSKRVSSNSLLKCWGSGRCLSPCIVLPSPCAAPSDSRGCAADWDWGPGGPGAAALQAVGGSWGLEGGVWRDEGPAGAAAAQGVASGRAMSSSTLLLSSSSTSSAQAAPSNTGSLKVSAETTGGGGAAAATRAPYLPCPQSGPCCWWRFGACLW